MVRRGRDRGAGAYLRERLTTTPLRVCEDPVQLRHAGARRIPRSYIACTRSGFGQTAARARAAGWDCHELATGHMAMETAPAPVAALLLRIAAGDAGGA